MGQKIVCVIQITLQINRMCKQAKNLRERESKSHLFVCLSNRSWNAEAWARPQRSWWIFADHPCYWYKRADVSFVDVSFDAGGFRPILPQPEQSTSWFLQYITRPHATLIKLLIGHSRHICVFDIQYYNKHILPCVQKTRALIIIIHRYLWHWAHAG
jgi:hypothetical protein